MLPPLHYQGLDAAQPFGYQPPPVRPVAPYAPSPVGVGAPGVPGQGSPMGMGVQPAIIGGATPGMQGPQGASVGMVRSADEMMEGGGGAGVDDGGPAAKRQKVAKLPGGQLYPEQDWINMHPVSNACLMLFVAIFSEPLFLRIEPYHGTSPNTVRQARTRPRRLARDHPGPVTRPTRLHAPRPDHEVDEHRGRVLAYQACA